MYNYIIFHYVFFVIDEVNLSILLSLKLLLSLNNTDIYYHYYYFILHSIGHD